MNLNPELSEGIEEAINNMTPEQQEECIRTVNLMEWLDNSTSNFMAVESIKDSLEECGFKNLKPEEKWDLKAGGKYYTIRNNTAIFAFIIGTDKPADAGFHIISSHSDSPGFKLKPNPEIYGDGGVVSLNVEKYGGGIMYTWFDRPLSIAARLMIKTDNPMRPEVKLIDLVRPIAVIPHLAIHFNRGVNEGNPLSVQKDMKPVIGYFTPEQYEEYKKKGGVVKSLIAEEAGVSPEDILGMEAVLYPVQSARLAGVNEEYIMSPRLDDLSMAFASLQALIDASDIPSVSTRVMAVFDNEETGSGTRQGAAAPTLRNILERIVVSQENGKGDKTEAFFRALEHSFMISADDAHAWHPNYNDKYDPTNHPVIGGGPVVKINANCKYMTDARGEAIFKALCEKGGVECQYFVNHGDVAGGSTLGNILTSQLDIAGVDMGCGIWAMHSACETGDITDYLNTVKVFDEFYSM